MIRDRWHIDKEYKLNCMEVLTENLSSLRAKANITQAELANLLGISRQTYSAIELNKKKMSWQIYLTLLLLYDTNASTHVMLRDLKVYPRELMIKMTNAI